MVFQLMRDELESTTAYLGMKAKIRSIPYKSPNLPLIAGDENVIFHTIAESISSFLPEAAIKKIVETIISKCVTSASTRSAIPHGSPSMIAGRASDYGDFGNNRIFWSCGFGLRLFESRVSWPRSSKSYHLEGTLNMVRLTCCNQTIEVVERNAQHDFKACKTEILHQYPRVPLLTFPRDSILGSHPSVELECARLAPDSGTSTDGAPLDEEMALKDALQRNPAWAATIFAVKETIPKPLPLNLAPKVLYDIKSYIVQELHHETTFSVNNCVVAVYPAQMANKPACQFRDFEPNGKFSTFARLQPGHQDFFKIIHEKASTYEELLMKIKAADRH